MFQPITLAAGVIAISIAAALAALLLLSALPLKRQRKRPSADLPALPEQAIFLFDGRELVDATGAAMALLDAIPGPGSEWGRLSGYLSERLRHFDSEMARLAERGEFELTGRDGRDIRLRAEWLGERARLTVTDLAAEGQALLVDALSQRAQEEELVTLRETLEAAPILVWREDEEGAVVWANGRYLDRVAEQAEVDQDDMTWPIPAILPGTRGADPSAPRRQRLSKAAGGPARWYDCHSHPNGTGTLHFALPADTAVKAETALHEFVQTLTRTFAHLPIGLAIFDRQRQLALFNPALVDLTAIGAEFLSARPTLFSFLDRLREARVIPEPKDYRSWRAQMAELEKAAASGLYEETWTLPSGQTYKVTGRPHADGAVAFLFQDISAEITLTRHFRSEIELGQAVVDTLGEAIAVFSPAGDLILSNAAYDRVWGTEPGAALGAVTITDSVRIWKARTQPTPVWGEVRDFVAMIEERAEWEAEATLNTGEALACRIAPLPRGATLVGFEAPVRPKTHRSGRADATPAESASAGA